MILFNLFWAFFQIGLFSFGGGYAALPLIREQVVLNNAWMTAAEFTDLITISQMTPGPIAINAASFIGARLAGIPGAVVATIGNILPSCAIALLLAFLYRKYHNLALISHAMRGLRPAVVGMIAAAALSMIAEAWFADTITAVCGVDLLSVGLTLAAFFALRKWKLSPIPVMLGCGIIGMCAYMGTAYI